MRAQNIVVAALTATLVSVASAPAFAQGCILIRQTSPLFGTTGALDQEVGTWTITFSGRASVANKHYNGTERQIQREIEQTYVVNRQNSITATVGYQFSPRISLTAGVPFVEASWGIPSPRAGGPATRANENARGIGDITTLARVALFNPATSTRSWNVIFGGGVKMPTGNNAASDVFPDSNGNNNLERYVDISVHPGDGGWGVIMDFQGYKQLGRVTAFGSSTWLANPRDTGTASRGNLVTATTPSNVNTVSDQFLFRAGAAVPITSHITASLSWRAEGVPRYDLMGASHGFRRPGVEMYWEPGVTITEGRHSMSFNFPVGYYFNRFPNPYTGTPGDSTFPEYVSIATYSVRLGGKFNAHSTPGRPATDQPSTPRTPEVIRPGEGA
ncbi:MAG TPA: hypothetical protein VFD21_01390 [Vicinamibacterales bacterium]|jgi:hypothetical protein|nr:hypothetical protein [Vicinamibacterales bacterium]